MSMNSTIDANAFSAALKKLVAAVPKKSAVPALTGILAEFTGDSCRLTAGDLNVWMRASLPADGDTFSLVFPDPQNMERICGHFKGELSVELWGTEDAQKAALRCGGKGAEFPVMPTQNYPKIPACEPTAIYRTGAESLYGRIKSVKYATAHWNSKNLTLGGVRFEGAHVFCVDGQRMAVNDDKGLTVKEPFIIPAPAMEHLKAFGKEEIGVAVGKRYVNFEGGSVSLLCRRMEPVDGIHVETSIPRTSKEAYHVDRKKYSDTIQYLLACAKGMRTPYALFRGGCLTVWNGDAMYQAKVETAGESELEYAFDLRYMKDALTQFSGEEYVQIKTSGGISPLVLSAGGAATALVLTVRLGGAWMKDAA